MPHFTDRLSYRAGDWYLARTVTSRLEQSFFVTPYASNVAACGTLENIEINDDHRQGSQRIGFSAIGLQPGDYEGLSATTTTIADREILHERKSTEEIWPKLPFAVHVD